MIAKAEIRKTMLARRREMAADARAASCGYVCEKLLALPMPPKAVIAGYLAANGEVDILQALTTYHHQQNPICLPVVSKPEKNLEFLAWTPEAKLRAGAHNILEPEGGENLVPQVLLVPLVAFDRAGNRLGYGAGYYDITIAALKKQNPDLRSIGIAFAMQEVDSLPVETHDMKLDQIVTEHEIIILR